MYSKSWESLMMMIMFMVAASLALLSTGFLWVRSSASLRTMGSSMYKRKKRSIG